MNRNKIIAIVMLIFGIVLLSFGAYSVFKDNNKDITKQPSNVETNDQNPNDEGELPEDYVSLEEGLIFSNFKITKSEEDEEMLVTFSLLNNKDVNFKTDIMKINIYDSKKENIETYEYEIEEIEPYDEIGVETNIALEYKNYSYEVVLGDTKTIVKANTDDVYKIN